MLGGQRASAIPESFADGINPTFALDGFKKDGADGIVEFSLEIGDVIETHELGTGNDGRKGQAILFRGGHADGAKRAAMKRILERQETMFLCGCPRRLVRTASVQPRKFHTTVYGFRAAVGEDRAIEARPCGEFSSERALGRIWIEIREGNGTRSFA